MTNMLRLAVGSHQAGSGKGCAMNVVSWENGDKTITDYPECADRFLARVVQRINDSICSHRDNNLLCPDCSIKVLALAHRTVGTSLIGIKSDRDRAEVYAKIARTEVFYAAAYTADAADAANAAANAAYTAADAAYTADAANAAAYTAYTAANAAANAAAYTANAAYAKFLIAQGHRIIDQFEAFSGIKAKPVAETVVDNAITNMMAVSR